MNPAQLLEHFDRVSEAPGAVARLRCFILDLAVRGKLVEQDSNDEPAAELLKRIQAEKARLVKEGAIRRQAALPSVSNDEQPFDLPKNWCWSRFGEIADFSAGRTPSRHDLSFWNTGEHPWVSIADMKDGATLVSTKETVSEKAKTQVFGSEPAAVGTLIMSFKLTIGKIARLGVPAFHNEAIISIRPHFPELDDYLFKVLPQFSRQGDTKDAIKGATLNRDSISNILLPLPPLAEQHRIAAKVDELMALCDQLEAAKNEREARRDRLVAASLRRIGTAPTAANEAATEAQSATPLRDAARFHLDHLPRLTTRPEHIKQLRQTILNLAVRGRLVPQEPNDEPVAELLKRIQAEKAQLVKGGRLKKDKQFWDGLPKVPSYEIPANWTWIQLQDAFEISRGGSPRPAGDPLYFGGPVPWITVREITKDDGKFLTKTETGLTELGATKSRFIDPGDLLLTNSGATLGVPKISQIRGCMNDGVAVLRQFHGVNLNDFAYLYLQSQTEAFRQINQGMGQPNLNTPIIAGWFFPLPPLAEQHRIVAKVDELIVLCGQLEAQLTTTQTDSRRLLEAALRDALHSSAVVAG